MLWIFLYFLIEWFLFVRINVFMYNVWKESPASTLSGGIMNYASSILPMLYMWRWWGGARGACTGNLGTSKLHILQNMQTSRAQTLRREPNPRPRRCKDTVRTTMGPCNHSDGELPVLFSLKCILEVKEVLDVLLCQDNTSKGGAERLITTT